MSPTDAPDLLPELRQDIRENLRSQLQFGRRAGEPNPTSGWLRDDGRPDPNKPQFTWLTSRTLHVYSAAALLGFARADTLATNALRRLTGVLHDGRNGGWIASVSSRGRRDAAKYCYVQAHVVIGAVAAAHAGIDGSNELLRDSLQVLEQHFWDEKSGTFWESWDQNWSALDRTHTATANMHGVEALLAAATILPQAAEREVLLSRALRVTSRLVEGLAATNEWRMPQHFDASWRPDLDYGSANPADPFAPYGATIGLGFEWARLASELHHAVGSVTGNSLLDAARGLYQRAVDDGWASDGHPGFPYTTDWSGKTVIAQRLHWVHAEAVSAAATLWSATGDSAYASNADQWWKYILSRFVDASNGSWRHELSSSGRSTALIWEGRPDLYHSINACLLSTAPTVRTPIEVASSSLSGTFRPREDHQVGADVLVMSRRSHRTVSPGTTPRTPNGDS